MVESRAAPVRWLEYWRGDWQVLHLRDGCPFLPYSGRPFHSVARQNDAFEADVRLPSWLATGSIWQVLWLNDELRRAIRYGYRQILDTLTARLNRPPQIGDLLQFGEGATCLADRDGDYTTDTVLEHMLPVTLG